MDARKNNSAYRMSFGGVFAALAVVIMCLGGLIPLATYVCPMACIMILDEVRKRCGSRIAWAWWGAVAVLSVLLGPDKEGAAIFVFLGYYPMVRVKIQGLRFRFVLKLVVFNSSILVMYWVLIRLVGMEELMKDFAEMGRALLIATMVLGNIAFVLLDLILTRGLNFGRRHG